MSAALARGSRRSSEVIARSGSTSSTRSRRSLKSMPVSCSLIRTTSSLLAVLPAGRALTVRPDMRPHLAYSNDTLPSSISPSPRSPASSRKLRLSLVSEQERFFLLIHRELVVIDPRAAGYAQSVLVSLYRSARLRMARMMLPQPPRDRPPSHRRPSHGHRGQPV